MIKKLLRTVPALVIWFLISFFLWGFVFGILRNPPAEKKVVIYADVPAMADTDLAVALEAEMPAGLKMIEAHPFFYAMFGSDNLPVSDIYLVRKENGAAWAEEGCFAGLEDAGALPALESALAPFGGTLGAYLRSEDGTVWGIKVYDAATGTGIAKNYIIFESEAMASADYYLCFSSSSAHIGDADEKAIDVACRLIGLG